MVQGRRGTVLYLLQYPVAALVWLWLFSDAVAVRVTAGSLLVAFAALAMWKPELLVVGTSLFGKSFPERIQTRMNMSISGLLLVFGVMILSGFRMETDSQAGLVGIIVCIHMIMMHLWWISISGREERSEHARYWVFSFISIAAFLALSIFLLSRGGREIQMFRTSSPYPMMAVFLIMGIWHYLKIRRKERLQA